MSRLHRVALAAALICGWAAGVQAAVCSLGIHNNYFATGLGFNANNTTLQLFLNDDGAGNSEVTYLMTAETPGHNGCTSSLTNPTIFVATFPPGTDLSLVRDDTNPDPSLAQVVCGMTGDGFNIVTCPNLDPLCSTHPIHITNRPIVGNILNFTIPVNVGIGQPACECKDLGGSGCEAGCQSEPQGGPERCGAKAFFNVGFVGVKNPSTPGTYGHSPSLANFTLAANDTVDNGSITATGLQNNYTLILRPTQTASQTPTITLTPSFTVTPTVTPTATRTVTPTFPTFTPTSTVTLTPTFTFTPTPTVRLAGAPIDFEFCNLSPSQGHIAEPLTPPYNGLLSGGLFTESFSFPVTVRTPAPVTLDHNAKCQAQFLPFAGAKQYLAVDYNAPGVKSGANIEVKFNLFPTVNRRILSLLKSKKCVGGTRNGLNCLVDGSCSGGGTCGGSEIEGCYLTASPIGPAQSTGVVKMYFHDDGNQCTASRNLNAPCTGPPQGNFQCPVAGNCDESICGDSKFISTAALGTLNTNQFMLGETIGVNGPGSVTCELYQNGNLIGAIERPEGRCIGPANPVTGAVYACRTQNDCGLCSTGSTNAGAQCNPARAPRCVGGSSDGNLCDPTVGNPCPGGGICNNNDTCPINCLNCLGGSNNGSMCADNTDCPGGTCSACQVDCPGGTGAFCVASGSSCDTSNVVLPDQARLGTDDTAASALNMLVKHFVVQDNGFYIIKYLRLNRLLPTGDSAIEQWIPNTPGPNSNMIEDLATGNPDGNTTMLSATSSGVTVDDYTFEPPPPTLTPIPNPTPVGTQIVRGMSAYAVAENVSGTGSKPLRLGFRDATNTNYTGAGVVDLGPWAAASYFTGALSYFPLGPFTAVPVGEWTEPRIATTSLRVRRETGSSEESRITAIGLSELVSLPLPPTGITLRDVDGDGQIRVCIDGHSVYDDINIAQEIAARTFQVDSLLQCTRGGIGDVDASHYVKRMLYGQNVVDVNCVGGSNVGVACLDNSDCPGGTCPQVSNGSLSPWSCKVAKGTQGHCDYTFWDFSVNDFNANPNYRKTGFCHDNGGPDSGAECTCIESPRTISEPLGRGYCKEPGNFGDTCVSSADCPPPPTPSLNLDADFESCTGGSNYQNLCAVNGDCPSAICSGRAYFSCEAAACPHVPGCRNGICVQRVNQSNEYDLLTDLFDEIDRINLTTQGLPFVCVGGVNQGKSCGSNANCPGSTCAVSCQNPPCGKVILMIPTMVNPNFFGNWGPTNENMDRLRDFYVQQATQRGWNYVDLYKEFQEDCGGTWTRCLRDPVHPSFPAECCTDASCTASNGVQCSSGAECLSLNCSSIFGSCDTYPNSGICAMARSMVGCLVKTCVGGATPNSSCRSNTDCGGGTCTETADTAHCAHL